MNIDRRVFCQQGFSLIELLVTVAIIAIISAVAVPSYVQYTARANRADAKTVLLANAQFMERKFTESNCYQCAAEAVATISTNFKQPEGGKYVISLVDANTDANTYQLLATRAGSMASDACGDLTLNELGVKGNTNNTATAATCWAN